VKLKKSYKISFAVVCEYALMMINPEVCKSGMTNARKIWLTRHGESVYNQKALIGGDSPLSVNGRAYADVLPEVIMSRLPKNDNGTPVPVSVWTSTLQRTIQTAAALPFAKLRWKALDEIDAGICDGMTYAEISEKYPHEFEARKKDKLRYRYPRGESYLDLIARLEPVISEMEREGESIVIVGHQAVLRVIFGYLMAQPQSDIPSISIPLHTVIELTPRPDGTMGIEFIPVPIHLSDAANQSMGDVPTTPCPEVAAAGGCSYVQEDGVAADLLNQQGSPDSTTSTTTTTLDDAAMVIGEAGLPPKGLGSLRGGSASSQSSIRDLSRMASCSSSSTIAHLAAARATGSFDGATNAELATGSSGVQPTWLVN
jgi:6-phosphofructo-2-kinase/fructose-2,6-biphosphatase